MSAASADREAKRSEGRLKAFPVAASATIYKGTLVGILAGYLVPMSDTAGIVYSGVAYERADNAGGSAGALTCRVYQDGEFELAYAGGDAAQTLVELPAYAQDDQTVDEDASLKVQTYAVGRIVEVISAAKVRLNIGGFAGGGAGLMDVSRYPKRRVTAKTSAYTVLAGESGQVFSTDGAGAAVTFSMPAAVTGLEYFFRVGAAQELRIDPNGSETIALPSTGVQGAAGKYLTADANGETVHLLCTKSGQWSVVGYTGTWTAEA